ncbi:MAG TPA: nitrate reductase [Verrucomicrobiae bacterium]|nr:nitrate reductase [Verrucomicrobiae bacterium]
MNNGTANKSLLREWTGPLTQELVLHPAGFGLGRVPAHLQPEATTTTVCGFCSTGCGLDAHLRDGKAINLTANTDYPVNLGMACPKGWEALTPLRAPDRATTPLLRNAAGKLEPVDWETAMQVFTLRFKAIQDKCGAEALAWLGTGQICTEELALLGALGKFGMSIIHGDGNTRQCMATAVAAYKESFGFDAPPYTYGDFEQSDVLVFVGSNLCITHPILWQRVLRNRNYPRIIVVDPRKTETAMAATQHVALKPKSDLVLLYGLAHLLITSDWVDHNYISQHTTGFNEFREFVRVFTPDAVAAQTGLTVGELFRFAETIHNGKAVSFWWTMGVNQGHEATRTAQAIINLSLMTGNMGRPGTGANSITGQCNAMGSRLFSNTTNLLGGRDFLKTQHREDVAEILGIPIARIPSKNSLAYDQILQAIADDKIKGLWIVATNTAHSWINQSFVHELRRRLDFLVVQDMFHTTETAQLADLVLPAAGWGEKEGTFINSERRIGLTKKVARAPGHALSDFNIFKLVAHYWGCADLFTRWTSPEAVFQILKKLSAGQPCDFSGVHDYQQLDDCGGIQWPLAQDPDSLNGSHAQESFKPVRERRLFEDGRFFTPDGKARFIFEKPRAQPEAPDEDYPFILLTGRGTSVQWHTGTRTEKSDVLRKLRPSTVYVEINPDDARRFGIASHSKVNVTSRRGTLVAKAFITSTIQPGQVFIPMHYAEANRLTLASFDPYSRQPSYKACAVRVEHRPATRRDKGKSK